MRFSFTVHAASHGAERFAPGAFDRNIGENMAVKVKGGNNIDGVIRSAEISEDGRTALITVEIETEIKLVSRSRMAFDQVTDPSLPPNRVVLVGSCWCGHGVADHGHLGCTVRLGPETTCTCSAPVTSLAKVIDIDPEIGKRE